MKGSAFGLPFFRLYRRMWLWVLSVILLVLVIAWLSGSFTHRLEPSVVIGQQQATDVGEVIPVEARQVDDMVSTVGTVRAMHQTEVGSRLLAQVLKVNASSGQYVHQGDVLVELDSTDLQARYSQAQANVQVAQAQLNQAESDFDKLRHLREQGAATQGEFEDARRTLEVTRAMLVASEQALRETQSQFEYATIRSPFDGIIVDTYIEPGDLAKAGMTLLSMHDKLQLEASVPERLVVNLNVGDQVMVELDAIDLKCHGNISEIVPEAEVASRAFTVKVSGPCPPGVYSGMFGRMLITVGTRMQLLVPRTSVGRVGQLEMVKVVHDDSDQAVQWRSTSRMVRTGQVLGDDIEILAGLVEGEKILRNFNGER